MLNGFARLLRGGRSSEEWDTIFFSSSDPPMSPASWTMKLLVMSRGLGKLQRRILEHLETAGRWQSAQQVITALTDSSESERPCFKTMRRLCILAISRADGLLATRPRTPSIHQPSGLELLVGLRTRDPAPVSDNGRGGPGVFYLRQPTLGEDTCASSRGSDVSPPGGRVSEEVFQLPRRPDGKDCDSAGRA